MATSQTSKDSGYDTGRAVQLAGVAALGGFLFGFDTAVINGAVDALAEDFELGPLLKGFSVSTALLGAAAGAFLAGRVADRIGRVRTLVIAAGLFLVSAIGTAFAFGPVDLIFWRVVGGVGVGAASVIAPAYIAEISPAAIRGRLGSLFQLAIVVGILLALGSDLLIATLAGSAGAEWLLGISAWRWMFLVEVLPALVFGVLALQIPESPRYLVANGRDDEARAVLGQVLGEGLDERMDEIHRTVQLDRRASLSDLRASGSLLLPIVWVGMGLALFQQFVGINVIFYYSTTLWQSVGFEESNALFYSLITGCGERGRDARRHRHHRPRGAAAAAHGRVHRHGALAWHARRRLRERGTGGRRAPAVQRQRPGGARRRQPVRRVLRRHVGPGHVGAPRRGVQ